MAEGAPLLREYGLKAHRGFESLPLRHMNKKALVESPSVFNLLATNPPFVSTKSIRPSRFAVRKFFLTCRYPFIQTPYPLFTISTL